MPTILLTAPSNYAADLLCYRLDEYVQYHNSNTKSTANQQKLNLKMLRLNATNRD